MTQAHTAGATRAAIRIDNAAIKRHTIPFHAVIAEIIDAETHCPEMQAFIERVKEGDFDTWTEAELQATALLKKVRGL